MIIKLRKNSIATALSSWFTTDFQPFPSWVHHEWELVASVYWGGGVGERVCERPGDWYQVSAIKIGQVTEPRLSHCSPTERPLFSFKTKQTQPNKQDSSFLSLDSDDSCILPQNIEQSQMAFFPPSTLETNHKLL